MLFKGILRISVGEKAVTGDKSSAGIKEPGKINGGLYAAVTLR